MFWSLIDNLQLRSKFYSFVEFPLLAWLKNDQIFRCYSLQNDCKLANVLNMHKNFHYIFPILWVKLRNFCSTILWNPSMPTEKIQLLKVLFGYRWFHFTLILFNTLKSWYLTLPICENLESTVKKPIKLNKCHWNRVRVEFQFFSSFLYFSLIHFCLAYGDCSNWINFN